MTEDNRRRNLLEELARGAEALRAAEALAPLGLHADAVSRAYYAAFHALRALLMSRGLEARTHGGTVRLFNQHFVQPGLLPTSFNRLLGGLQRGRELADYDAAVRFSAEDAAADIADARLLLEGATALLRTEGWLPTDA